MKTFKQFLAEEDLLDLNKFINKNCHEFISDANGLDIVRGFRELKTKIGKIDGKEVRYSVVKTSKIREPLSMPTKIHHLIDDWFYKNFGWRARSSGVFCFGESNLSHATDFGVPYIVYPIGPYEIAWSEIYRDLYVSLDSRYGIENFSNLTADDIDDFLRNGEYEAGDLRLAIRSKNEIMINCDSYLLISYEDYE